MKFNALRNRAAVFAATLVLGSDTALAGDFILSRC